MSIIQTVIRNRGLLSKIALAASVTGGLVIGNCSKLPATTTTSNNSGKTQSTSRTTGTVSISAIDTNASPSTRKKFLWPFSPQSPWNMPIGSGAKYVPANIQQAYFAGADEEYIYKINANDPVRSVYAPGAWGPGRCTGTTSQGTMQFPDSLIVPDATNSSTPNNSSAFLMPDGQNIVQLNPLARCKAGSNVYGWRDANVSSYGDGISGSHGGSGLSAIGGSVRLGELTGSAPIRHALKIELWAEKYYYYSGANSGYRWPADRADNYAADAYHGTNKSLVQGSLLAIPPKVTETSLGLQTAAGRKLFHALQDYGAYVVDDSAWDCHSMAVEKGVIDQFRNTYGYDLQGTSGTFYDDYMKLFKALAIVDNNRSDNVGGGGTPRAPLAPPIGD